MNTRSRLIRVFGTAAVGVFLMAGVAFGANAIGQAPQRSIDSTLTTSDETASPAIHQLAEPTDTAEPSETAESTETAEPTETAEAEHELAEDHGTEHGENATETPEPMHTARSAATATPTTSPDDHGGDSGHDGGDDSGHDGGGHD